MTPGTWAGAGFTAHAPIFHFRFRDWAPILKYAPLMKILVSPKLLGLWGAIIYQIKCHNEWNTIMDIICCYFQIKRQKNGGMQIIDVFSESC